MHKRQSREHTQHNTSWNHVARWYDDLVADKGSEYHQQVIIPSVIKMLKPRKQETVLDVGCGQGVLCRKLSSHGAYVTGIDAAPALIQLAKKHARPDSHQTYIISSATYMPIIKNNSFDTVVSVLALQNMDPLGKVVSEMVRVLKSGGRMLWVLNHPCFRIPRQSGWGIDERRKLQYRRIDSYLSALKIPIHMHPGAAPDTVTWTFHHALSDYINMISDHGCVVTRFEEWTSHKTSQPGAMAKAENHSRKEIPLFCALMARKDKI